MVTDVERGVWLPWKPEYGDAGLPVPAGTRVVFAGHHGETEAFTYRGMWGTSIEHIAGWMALPEVPR